MPRRSGRRGRQPTLGARGFKVVLAQRISQRRHRRFVAGVPDFEPHRADAEPDGLCRAEEAGGFAVAAMSTEEAIAYAQRGRGERKRPTSGWASLTPTERDVVRLVSDGLANNDIAGRLFVSPRTVQTHLTHVYTKLGLTSRVQLVQEEARHV